MKRILCVQWCIHTLIYEQEKTKEVSTKDEPVARIARKVAGCL